MSKVTMSGEIAGYGLVHNGRTGYVAIEVKSIQDGDKRVEMPAGTIRQIWTKPSLVRNKLYFMGYKLSIGIPISVACNLDVSDGSSSYSISE